MAELSFPSMLDTIICITIYHYSMQNKWRSYNSSYYCPLFHNLHLVAHMICKRSIDVCIASLVAYYLEQMDSIVYSQLVLQLFDPDTIYWIPPLCNQSINVNWINWDIISSWICFYFFSICRRNLVCLCFMSRLEEILCGLFSCSLCRCCFGSCIFLLGICGFLYACILSFFCFGPLLPPIVGVVYTPNWNRWLLGRLWWIVPDQAPWPWIWGA